MIDELRHAFELAQQQPEAIQRYIAELVTQELSSEEIEVTRELAAELEATSRQRSLLARCVRSFAALRMTCEWAFFIE